MNKSTLCSRCILVILGPSGGGKDTVIDHMEQRGPFECCKRITTRPPRSNGDDHKRNDFVNPEEFNPEGVLMPNEYAGYWYGIPPQNLHAVISQGKIPILKGVFDNIPVLRQQMAVIYPDKTVRVVYLFPDSEESWMHRVEKRGKDHNTSERIRESIREMEQARRSLQAKDGLVDLGVVSGHYQPSEEIVQDMLGRLCQGCQAAN